MLKCLEIFKTSKHHNLLNLDGITKKFLLNMDIFFFEINILETKDLNKMFKRCIVLKIIDGANSLT